MTLKEWREKNGIKLKWVASQVGVTVFCVWCWENDRRRPWPRNAAAIERITNGDVPMKVWLREKENGKGI